MKKHAGKFIVFEGLDGSGKATQTKLLYRRLKKEGRKVFKIDFPQYGTKSAGPVEEYLNGKYGSAEDVGAYRASIFFACDRYDASFTVRKHLEKGDIVLADRYVSSNMAHQGGKIRNRQARTKFFQWLYELEYGIFGIPKPNNIIILKTSPMYSLRLAHVITDQEKLRKRKAYLGRKKRDIHEKDVKHLQNTYDAYVHMAQLFPKDFIAIECLDDGKLLPPNVIHEKIWQYIKRRV